MSFKEFHQEFGRNFPLSVTRMAFGFFQNGHSPAPSLSTASILYAARYDNRPLFYTGYAIVRHQSVLSAYKLETETVSGLQHLSPINWLCNHGAEVSRLGEHCRCTPLMNMAYPNDSVLGTYTHRNRYASVVKLTYNGDIMTEKTMKNLQNVADILAMNAIAWYPQYLKTKARLQHKFQSKKETPVENSSVDWTCYLCGSTLRFIPQINSSCEHDSDLKGRISIADFLKQLQQKLQCRLTVSEVRIFGM